VVWTGLIWLRIDIGGKARRKETIGIPRHKRWIILKWNLER
jgi:hypothetical protein